MHARSVFRQAELGLDAHGGREVNRFVGHTMNFCSAVTIASWAESSRLAAVPTVCVVTVAPGVSTRSIPCLCEIAQRRDHARPALWA